MPPQTPGEGPVCSQGLVPGPRRLVGETRPTGGLRAARHGPGGRGGSSSHQRCPPRSSVVSTAQGHTVGPFPQGRLFDLGRSCAPTNSSRYTRSRCGATSLLRFMPDVKHECGGLAGESRSVAHGQLAPGTHPTSFSDTGVHCGPRGSPCFHFTGFLVPPCPLRCPSKRHTPQPCVGTIAVFIPVLAAEPEKCIKQK